MVDRRVIEDALIEQQEEINALKNRKLCHRPEEELIDLDSNLAQVVIGVRRSGKSTLCYNTLVKSGKKFAYINFDDERLAEIGMSDLNSVLEVAFKVYGQVSYLLLDEIQNVEGWHLFVNRLLRQGMHVIVTGSNAKLLSSELATHLTGRYLQVELLPLSFPEFATLNDVDVTLRTTRGKAAQQASFDAYMSRGGFPELATGKIDPQRYVTPLLSNVIGRDIEQRFKIRYARSFEQLTQHLLNTVPCIVVEKTLARMLEIKSQHTVGNYIGYLKQGYLLCGVQRYSTKSRLRVRDEKLYPIDVTLMNARPDALVGDNLGWRLEVMVYLELRRRNAINMRDIYYFKNSDGHEADFVVCRGNRVEEIYQVCYDLSHENTRKRELRGLLVASRQLKCDKLMLITDFQRETVEMQGKSIQIVPAYEWMLNNQ